MIGDAPASTPLYKSQNMNNQTTLSEDVTELVDAPANARDDAQARARACADELAPILDKHRCRILPRLELSDIEPVGLAGDKIQLAATYWIAPMP